ncbi:tetratricopeptide repeat protein [Thalassococcus lentus]|uniref:Cell division coordinator CpoB n=2 Tax=Thalassococcus lentus TaxID=1210524 RepID=A0ABT4XTH2_9RHOB|nr:tetratricopeptide repeat protein [Thalassococcus lentus]MDA7425195.1 tetratricopeptide repeat protein [Thalassococcus lentus]
MMRFVFALVLGLSAGGMAPAQQSETLADIRQDLSILFAELQRLRTELSTTGASSVQTGGAMLDRVNVIEAELQRITAKTEELEFRINQVVRDGTNRVGDLEFRLCELEPGCDIGSLGDTPRLGGDAVPAPVQAAAAAPAATDALPSEGGELAISEEADFRAAQQALDDGDFQAAARMFAQFREIYPQGPLDAAALLGEGRALEGAGDTREAARRYLQAYSGYPEARVAPETLWRLGLSLAALGSVPEACVTLSEVGGRYPQSDFASRAQTSRDELGCS